MFNPYLFLAALLGLYEILLVIRILMSWVAPRANWYNQPMKFLYDITEFSMAPFRRLIPPIGGLDLSPILLFILINLLRNLLVNLGAQYGGSAI